MQRNSLLNDPVIYEQSDIRKGYNKEFINDNNDIYNKSNDIGVPSITSIANLEYSCKITDILNNQKFHVTSIAYREYSCKITEILNDDKFEVKAINLKDENDVIFLTFPFDDVDACDRDLIQIGAIFIFSIGKQRVSGSIQKYEKIVFHRFPVYNKSFLEKIENLEINIDDLFE